MRIAFCDDSSQDREAVWAVLKEMKLEADAFENGSSTVVTE